MKRIKKQLSIVLVLALVAIPMVVLASPPAIPLLVWGNVIIDGQPAPANTRILAEIDDEEVASTIVTAEGKYFIGIPDGKANEGETIVFKVNGITNDSNQCECVNIDTTPSVKFDLAVTATRSCSISYGQGIQTWNGSGWGDCTVSSCNSGYHQEGNSCVADSSSGGSPNGGGTIPSPSYSTGDINKDGSVDFDDFSMFALLYGKTYTNSDEKVENIFVSWGDYDEDGDVDFTDFAEFALSYGK